MVRSAPESNLFLLMDYVNKLKKCLFLATDNDDIHKRNPITFDKFIHRICGCVFVVDYRSLSDTVRVEIDGFDFWNDELIYYSLMKYTQNF